MTSSADFDSLAVIELTTTGRVTGRPHRVEIWFALREATIYVLSGGGNRSDWVRNLTYNSEATIRAGESEYVGVGRIVIDKVEERLARDAVFAKYSSLYSGNLSEWRNSALPIAIDLDLIPGGEAEMR